MVTQLLRAMTFDVLQSVKSPDFFTLAQAKRDAHVSTSLPEYPAGIAKYVRSVSENEFVADAEAILQVLGSGGSVITDASRLTRSGNGFFVAMLDSLKAVLVYESSDTQLGVTLASFQEAGSKYSRVLRRELQLLLMAARGEDSAIVQVAAPTEVDVSALPGVPEVAVQRQLLGGARVFFNGKLKDDSWRARLTQVLSVIS